MRIDVLGPIQITAHGRAVQLAGQRQRALLAGLALEFGKVVPVDRLVDILWDVDPPPTARVKVQAHVCALRQAIGHDTRAASGPLVTQPPGYVLCREGTELDLAEFDSLIARAKDAVESARPAAASELFGDALAMWRGSAFADVRSPAPGRQPAKHDRPHPVTNERNFPGAEIRYNAIAPGWPRRGRRSRRNRP